MAQFRMGWVSYCLVAIIMVASLALSVNGPFVGVIFKSTDWSFQFEIAVILLIALSAIFSIFGHNNKYLQYAFVSSISMMLVLAIRKVILFSALDIEFPAGAIDSRFDPLKSILAIALWTSTLILFMNNRKYFLKVISVVVLAAFVSSIFSIFILKSVL